MPYFVASFLNGALVRMRSLRSFVTSSGVNRRSGGRPNRLPWALACKRPALTLSTISERSNWATAGVRIGIDRHVVAKTLGCCEQGFQFDLLGGFFFCVAVPSFTDHFQRVDLAFAR